MKELQINLDIVDERYNGLDAKQVISECNTDPTIRFESQLDELEEPTGSHIVKITVDTTILTEMLRYPYGNSIIFKITETNTSSYTYWTSHFRYNVKTNPSSKIPVS
jgi:hypothetical protein